jgi:hypothetical protein
MIDPLEIVEIITDPNDTSRPMYYKRQWMQMNTSLASGVLEQAAMQAWYPAVEMILDEQRPGAAKINRVAEIGGKKVNWLMPLLRSRGASSPAKWRWPVPDLYASLDWARAYKEFLEDWATIQRTLSRFALMVETKGGPGAIAAYHALLGTTFANDNGAQMETNPPPVVGSAHISGPGNTVQPFKSANVQTSPEQARRMVLMVASAQGMPETFYGDASTGSLATAVSLDRPTELKFGEIQRRWQFVIKTLIAYVLLVGGQAKGSQIREVFREAKKKTKANAQATVRVVVKFPAVVEQALQPMIQAIAEVGTLGGRNGIAAGIVDRRTIADLFLEWIGVENRSELLDAMGYGGDYDPQDDIEDQRSLAAPQNITTQPTQPSDIDATATPTIPTPAPPGTAPGQPPPKPGAPPATAPPAKAAAAKAKAASKKTKESVAALRDGAAALQKR